MVRKNKNNIIHEITRIKISDNFTCPSPKITSEKHPLSHFKNVSLFFLAKRYLPMLVYQEGIKVLLTLVHANVNGMVLRLCQEILEIVVKQSFMSQTVLSALRKEVELERSAKLYKTENERSPRTASKSNIHSEFALRNSSQSSSGTSEECLNNSAGDEHKCITDKRSDDEDSDSTIDECDEEIVSSDADIPMQEPNNLDVLEHA